MNIFQFVWQPYLQYGDELADYIDDKDRSLFRSCTAMIFFWIAERHNPDRVMKQFWLRQIVPLPFNIPYERDERQSNMAIDYNVRMREIIAARNARETSVLVASGDDSRGRHSKKYLQWYRQITRLRVGRPDDKTLPSFPHISQTRLSVNPHSPTVHADPTQHASDQVSLQVMSNCESWFLPFYGLFLTMKFDSFCHRFKDFLTALLHRVTVWMVDHRKH